MKIVFSICVFCFAIEGAWDVDPVEVTTAIEGHSLTLHADFTETQTDGLAEWIVNETRIATINKATGKVEYSDVKLMMMFSGRLHLDQTGSLTIWNMRIKHSGEYTVESISSVGTKSKKFQVIVKESPLKSVEDNEEIKALLATEGNSETLHTDTELQTRDLILWRYGAEGSLIAKGDREDDHASHYDLDDGRFRNRLKMDNTGSLIISDIETVHAGEYRLKIVNDRGILFKRFTVTVSVPGLPPGAVAGICVVLMLAAAAAATGVGIYWRHRDSELKKLIPGISKQLQQLHEEKIPERLSEISENIKKVFESKKPGNPERLRTDVPKMEEGEGERLIHVEETALSLAMGDNKTSIDRQGRRTIAIRNPSTEQAGDHGTDVPKMEEGEGERLIHVEETVLSLAMGDNKTSIDRQGRRTIAIRNPSTEPAGDHGTDVPKMEEGEGERLIHVEETVLSLAMGDNKTSIDRQGRRTIAIRNPSTEPAGDHGTDVPKMEEGEGERLIHVEETVLSLAMGDNKTSIDRQGRRTIAIRNPSTEPAGDHGTDVPKMEEGEGERLIHVEETVLSLAMGDNKTSIDRQGRRTIAIRNPSTEPAGDHGTDVPKMEEGEGERLIHVEETVLSLAMGDNKTSIDRQGRRTIAIRNPSTEPAGDHGTDVPKMEEGEGERLIHVEETALSLAMGDNKTSIDPQGRRTIAIRNPSTEPAGDHGTDVPKMEEGEGERLIHVEETALSLAMGDNKTSIDRQGRRTIALRNPSTEQAGDHGTDVPKMEEGEGERLIHVEETALSLAMGDNKTSIDPQGRRTIAIRNPSTKPAGDHGTDVPKMEEGEGERLIHVEETVLSLAMGDNKTSIDRQGRRTIAIRNPSTEQAGDHESSGRETPSIGQIDDDDDGGEN
ncbi:uncharacterized protein LOC120486110 isoform X2 [Pimephales promelas]|uniref:uncharacterized protein LOC120486110 isoform X2 n=1 Tax=Pimephales promelas TaxID=90988 RepID=UPI001955C0F7|nr:uncharacterized protein LOC120486110 isoform X2 [Pimephales promelas]